MCVCVLFDILFIFLCNHVPTISSTSKTQKKKRRKNQGLKKEKN